MSAFSVEELLSTYDAQKATNTYQQRVAALKLRGVDTTRVEKGVQDVDAVLDQNARSFVVYGEPQSGKTEFMIALTCRLVDRGFRTIFVVMNDNTELEVQNFDRFRNSPELNPTPIRDTQLITMAEAELKKDRTRVIFCRKNSKNLQKLIDLCRYMKNRLVIDDEADFATPNSKINKNEVTAINKYLGELGKLNTKGKDAGVYIGVTATPGRLDLNNTFLNDSSKWVFLQSYPTYKGRKFFFPVTAAERLASDYQLVKLPDDTDDPKLLRHAVFRFMLRVAVLNLAKESEITPYSMLIHTAGKTRDHEEDQKAVADILSILQDPRSEKRVAYFRELQKLANFVISHHGLSCSEKDLLEFLIKYVGKHEILTINHQNDGDNMSRAGNPKSLFTFAIGGNIVSRGVTFERLLTFYFSRNVRGRLQQNTYIQRARMFGNRPYSKCFELCVPETLFQDWAQCFQDHELSLRLAMSGTYAHIQSGRNQVADNPSIDKENVIVSQSERPVGELFSLTKKLEEALVSHNGKLTLSFIEKLKSDGTISQDAISDAVLAYMKETCEPTESDVLLVTREEGGQRVLQEIERYADGDHENILRARGGIIHAMLNKSNAYVSNKHFILPIRNSHGKIRFLYKSNLGHTVYENVKKRHLAG